MSLTEILELLRAHAQGLEKDISLSQNRDNHIRMTTRALETHAIIVAVASLQDSSST